MRVRLPGEPAAAMALLFSVAVPASELWRLWVRTDGTDVVVAVVATAVYLPPHLRHVAYGLQGRRPRAAVPTLLVMAVAMGVAWLVIGQLWVFMFASLAVSIMCTLPTRVAVPAAVAVVLSPLLYDWSPPLSDAAYSGQYLTLALLFRSTALFVVVWLVAASGRLREVQVALSAAAVQEERAHLQQELRTVLGPRLGDLVELAERADGLAAAGDPATEPTVRHLIETSRLTLSQVKAIVDSYQRVAARPELEAVAELLTGAGIDAGLVRAARDRGQLVLPAQVGTAWEGGP